MMMIIMMAIITIITTIIIQKVQHSFPTPFAPKATTHPDSHCCLQINRRGIAGNEHSQLMMPLTWDRTRGTKKHQVPGEKAK